MSEKNNNIVPAAYGSDMDDDGRDVNINNNDDDLDAAELGEVVHEWPIIITWQLLAGSFDDLGTDELSHIFGFLPPKEIMRARLNNKMREAAKKTIVPMTDFQVRSVDTYNAMAAMATALPNLQQITLSDLRYPNRFGHKYVDGEDADESRAARTANWKTHEIETLSNFTRLRDLKIYDAPLNGRYPSLFNFPLLQSLSIRHCSYLKWDLEVLAGLRLLTELYCHSNHLLTGNINNFRVLKDSLEKVKIRDCRHVEGNFMDLADFPRLKVLNLLFTAVTGDIREIGEQDFSAVIELALPAGVYGGMGYQFQRISDGLEVISTLYSIKKQRPTLLKNWFGHLSVHSQDWYDGAIYDNDTPPFYIRFVQAGSRVGYRWETSFSKDPCEVNWLDPEPGKESSKYEKYIVELQEIELWKYSIELYEIEQQVDIYRGFHQPPSEEEYNRLWEDRRRNDG